VRDDDHTAHGGIERSTAPGRPPGLWVGQRSHFQCLGVLLLLVWFTWGILGEPSPLAFWCAVAIPIVHQIFVWLAWRLELRSAVISSLVGFRGYLAGFFILFGGRFVSLTTLAWLDRGSLPIPVLPQVLLTLLLTLPGVYAMYSVWRYFGMGRAAGADHFDRRYRDMPLVEDGIFRFTRNGMYSYAFLLFWAIAIGFNSTAALAVAAFSHAYIWIHYHSTEKADMIFLYQGSHQAKGRRPS